MRSGKFLMIFATILVTACNSGEKMNASLKTRVTLHEIPSASGIEFLDGKYWLIGDNSPWLFELNDAFELGEKHPVFPMDNVEKNGVIPKSRKHDYEAMTSLSWEGDSALFIFGSGSKTKRFQGVLVRIKNVIHPTVAAQKFDLTDFYSTIREKAKLKESELNIEAAAVLGDHLFLFNRGKNKLISIKVQHFIEYLSGRRETIKLKVKTIELPEIDGIRAGFSGATADEKFHRIVFTASVENTADWVADGEVLGSFIGVLNLLSLKNHAEPKCVLIKNKQEILRVKAESIALQESSENSFRCLVVTDSDGGNSELLKLKVQL
jgi:hypothetical protein